jgi:non-specific serine/threonine protein kinase
MGLGKTVTALEGAKQLNNSRVLIICPVTIKDVWVKHIEDWHPDCTYVVVKGNIDTRYAQIIHKANFIIMNYEQVAKHEDALLFVRWSGFILDEGHKLKNRKVKCFRVLSLLMKRNIDLFLFILTGTPIMNRPSEIWSLLHLIDGYKFRGYHAWTQEYLDMQPKYYGSNRWAKVEIGVKSTKRFQEFMDKYLLRREKDEVLDLPEKIIQDVYVTLSGEQEQVYRNMQENFYANVCKGVGISVPNIISQMIRLKQIANSQHILYNTTDSIEGAKLDALIELLEDVGNQKVVIFSQFKEYIIRLRALLVNKKYSTDLITGNTPLDNRRRIQERFQTKDDPQILCMTTQLGMGITLHKACIAIFLDQLWTPASNTQAEDRLHRIGQSNTVNIYRIQASDTIDIWIRNVLEQKQVMVDTTVISRTVTEAIQSGELK